MKVEINKYIYAVIERKKNGKCGGKGDQSIKKEIKGKKTYLQRTPNSFRVFCYKESCVHVLYIIHFHKLFIIQTILECFSHIKLLLYKLKE